MNRPTLVGHVVAFDVMGASMTHPATCAAVRQAVECPHYRALDRGKVVGRPTRGAHTAFLRDGVLHLLPAVATRQPEVAEEIGAFLDQYANEVGADDANGAVHRWLFGEVIG